MKRKLPGILKLPIVLAALLLTVAARKPLWSAAKGAALLAVGLQYGVSLPLSDSDTQTQSEEAVHTSLGEDELPSEPENVSTAVSAQSQSQQQDAYRIVTKQLISGSADTVYKGVALSNFTKQHTVNIAAQLAKSPVIDLYKNARPQILIIHTHTTERYLAEESEFYDPDDGFRSNDPDEGVVAVGKVVADILNEAGYVTVHETQILDAEYNSSYETAGAAIEKILKKYSSIEMVIDIHRDSITNSDGSKIAPTAEIDGESAAQIMLVAGCNEEGALPFPNWEYNLRTAVRLQQKAEQMYPGLTRPIYFIARRYNMHYTKNSLLIEVGSEVNTLSQALVSARMLGEALTATLDAL